MKHVIFFLFLFIPLHAQEFAYPVALFPEHSIAFIYQSGEGAIDLCVGDLRTNSFSSGLHSRFIPTHVTLLPGATGFSFIDNGMIRIKSFCKRSPKTLELSNPLYDISSMLWDDQFLYISAKYRNNYALFLLDSDGNNTWKLSDTGADFLYPQKQGENLFFIHRSIINTESKYTVSVFKYNSKNQKTIKTVNNNRFDVLQNSFTMQCDNSCTVGDVRDIKTIVDFGNQSIAYLTMEHETSGFVVAHPTSIVLTEGDDTQSKGVIFSYYHLVYDNKTWNKEKLFDFAIPFDFLVPEGKNRLYEYMAPLVPKKIDSFIYYSHSVNGVLNVFRYCLKTRASVQITQTKKENDHFFCPIQIGSHVYCGGSVFATKPGTMPLKKIISL